MTRAPPPLSPTQKARLGAEILLAYVQVKRSLSAHSLPSTVASLRASAGGRPDPTLLADDVLDSIRLARAVTRTLRAVPSGSRCLIRSLVLLAVLARRGVHGALVIAVLPTEEARLDAHAWIEVDERPLLAPAPHHGRLLML